MIEATELDAIIKRLRAQGTDDSTVEVKACSQRLSSDIWESVSSFANTSGGLIILGLDENSNFVPVKGFNLDRVRDQFVSGMGDGGQDALLANVPRYELSRGMVDGALVLLIEVDELDIRSKPCYIRQRGIQAGSYKRIDDKDIRLSPTELYEMQSILIPSDADGSIVPEATVEDLDQGLIDAVIESRRRLSPRMLQGLTTRESQLTRLNITNREGGVRLAGLLATGSYPQQFYPKLIIDVAVHPGTEKSEPDAPRFLDRQLCDGPLTECIEGALAAIRRNLRTRSYVVGSERRDELEIPEEVLREALSNAAIHREYSPMFLGESISVDIYPNRVEISNPGGLWGGKTLENLDNGDSRCRNTKLMSLMGAVPLRYGGYVAESQGSGVKAMIRTMEARSLARPQFRANADSFTVVFARRETEVEHKTPYPDSPAAKPKAEKVSTRSLRQQIVAAMRPGKSISARELAQSLGVSVSRVRYALPQLIEDGLVVPTAPENSRRRRYLLKE